MAHFACQRLFKIQIKSNLMKGFMVSSNGESRIGLDLADGQADQNYCSNLIKF